MTCHACGGDHPPNDLSCDRGHRRVVTAPNPATTTKDIPESATHVAVTEPDRGSAHDTTRYLCAAVQTDPALNDQVIRGIVDDERHAVASSPSVDLTTVLKYALAARQRQTIRDAILAVLAVVALVALPFSRSVVLLALIAAWAVVFAEAWKTNYSVLAPQLRREVFDPSKAPTPTSERLRRRLADVRKRDRGNLTVFANYTPFIGHGKVFQNWSFSLNVATPQEEKTVIPFTVHELYDHVTQAIGEIGLPGVAAENRLFVNGLDLLHELDPQVQNEILPDPLDAPVAHVDETVVKQLRDQPKSRARPYLAIPVTGWAGELVMTMFLRFTLLPRRDLLFIEASYSLLAPVRERYRAVDRLLSEPTGGQVVDLALVSAGRTLSAWLGSVPRMLSLAMAPMNRAGRERRDDRAALNDRTFNYGAGISVREAASDHLYYRYFQQLDNEMYAKLVERRVMDALVEFLESHNIDASDLLQRQTTILNHGVYVTGHGSLKADSVAAGNNAISSAINRFKPETDSGPQKA
jgi:hypothetical protein